MAITAAAPAARVTVPRGVVPASLVLGGTLLSLIGLTWDIQWHTDVGPDTFFTMPHLFLYSGSAISGLASLVVVLMTTADAKRGKKVDPIVGGRAVGVFGRTFAAPVGYLVSGIGAASFLVYGLWDQWWHGLYGFDAVIASPPHIGLLLSVSITMVGAVMIFAVAREQRWGTYGVIGSGAVLLTFSMVTVLGLRALPRGIVNTVSVGTAFFSVMILFMAAHVLHRRGALAVAVTVAALQAVFWWFSPWATEVYAAATGLPLRDYTDGVPGMPNMIPMCLIVVAVAVELLHRLPAWLPGAVGGVIITACAPLQNMLVFGTSQFPSTGRYVATIVAGAVFGALAGLLGRRFGRMLRHLVPAKENSHA